MTTLTPADKGILSAAFDDAISLNYGDDDMYDYLLMAARDNDIDESLVYNFMKSK